MSWMVLTMLETLDIKIEVDVGVSEWNLTGKSDWKYLVGAGLLGFPGGPSHFRAIVLSPNHQFYHSDCAGIYFR